MTPVADIATVEVAARRLRDAAATGSPCRPVRDLLGVGAGTAGGYRVQQHNTEHCLAEGRRRSGHKVGLTNEAVQEQLGMDEPIWGVLFADRCRTDGDETGDAGLIEPRVEVEVAVVLGADLDKGEHCVVDVIRAVDYVLPALEIVDSRIAGWDMNIVDMIADNAGSGLYVLGTQPVRLADVDLRRTEMRLAINGEPAAVGAGFACLGNPLNSVTWLADAMCENGTPLRAGECIMTGSLGPLRPVGPGDALRAWVDGLGAVSVRL